MSGSEAVVPVEMPKELQTPFGITAAIYSAIDAQRSAAISYVRSIRARQMTAAPSVIITTLERHYVVSVTASGTAVGATAFIPGAGTAVALGAGAAEIFLQFELAALFGLAVAEVHGLNIQNRDRARAVILTLMLGAEGRTKIAALAKAAISRDAASVSGTAGRSRQIANSSMDDLPLADLLGSFVPTDFVPSILDAVQDMAKKKLPEKAMAAGTRLLPGGIGMVLGGFGGYSAGSEVVQAARQAFGAAPEELPELLEPIGSDGDGVPDLGAFESGMRGALGAFVRVSGAAGGGIAGAATAVGSGVSAVATTATRAFRSVDLDGDGIPDEAQALTAAKNAGSAVKGAATGAAGAIGSMFRRKGSDDPS